MPPSYGYLLGLYLGDGCLSDDGRGVYRLRISCSASWPGIVAEAERAVHDALGGVVGRVPAPGCVVVGSYSKHWPCLFPQHGAGKKHCRRLTFEPWQWAVIDREPGQVIRGLIHSDGWRGHNRVGKYVYPRYLFINRSTDILELAGHCLDLLAVEWRYSKRWTISVARRDSVARLDEFVGPKY